MPFVIVVSSIRANPPSVLVDPSRLPEPLG